MSAPPLITYPTHYTFKAMGLAGPELLARVLAHVEQVLGKVEESAVSVPSLASAPASSGCARASCS